MSAAAAMEEDYLSRPFEGCHPRREVAEESNSPSSALLNDGKSRLGCPNICIRCMEAD